MSPPSSFSAFCKVEQVDAALIVPRSASKLATSLPFSINEPRTIIFLGPVKAPPPLAFT